MFCLTYMIVLILKIVLILVVTAKEIPKLLKRFAHYDPEGRNGGITLKQFLDIPEISTNPIMPKVTSAYLERRTNKLTSRSFISILSRLSPRNSLDDKKQCEYCKKYDVTSPPGRALIFTSQYFV